MVVLLEIARGLAALWVFLYHVQDNLRDTSLFLYSIAQYGNLGVPMFFVISGFVITYSAESTLKKQQSPLFFLKKRFLRIYPVFWASVLLVILLPYTVEVLSMLKSGRYQEPVNLIYEYSLSEWAHFLMLTKVFFANTGYLPAEFSQINAVYWTIAIEFQFYLIVCLGLYFRRYYRHFIVLMSVLSFINMLNPLGVNYGLFIHYWPSFCIGIALAYVFKARWIQGRIAVNKARIGWGVLSLTCILCIWLLTNDPSEYLWFALLFASLLWMISPIENVLVKLEHFGGKAAKFLLGAFVALGAMSYSVYLLHGKLQFLSALFVRQIVNESSLAFVLLTILLTLFLCYPFYLLVERPFMSSSYKSVKNS